MICEHWTEDGTDNPDMIGGDTVMESEAFKRPDLAWSLVGLKYCCTIEGETWEDVMTKYHEHMGWEPYVPMKL